MSGQLRSSCTLLVLSNELPLAARAMAVALDMLATTNLTDLLLLFVLIDKRKLASATHLRVLTMQLMVAGC